MIQGAVFQGRLLSRLCYTKNIALQHRSLPVSVLP